MISLLMSHAIPQFLYKLARFSRDFYSRHGRFIFSDVVNAIAIVAFFFAADYFTDKPSLYIDIWTKDDYQYRSFFKEFFEKNEIPVPAILDTTYWSAIMDEEKKYPSALTNPQGPVIEYIHDVLLDTSIAATGLVSTYKQMLGKSFNDLRYTKRGYMGPNFGGLITNGQFAELLCCVEDRYTSSDYLLILAAGIYCRTINQNILIKNDGDVDLSNIDVTIPAPLSRLTQRRDGNIIYYRVMGNLLYDVDQFPDRIILHIPRLKRGQDANIAVATRENELLNSDILTEYRSDKSFSLASIWFWLVTILSINWAIQHRSRKSRIDQVE